MRLALTLGVALAAVAHSSAFHLPRTPRSPIVGRHGTHAPRRLVSAPRMGLMDDAANLPPQKVVDALANGGRFAASDVAAKTGSSIEEAKRALRDLAALLGEEAGLEVSSDGELVYKLPQDVPGKLASRSNAAAARATWESVKPGLYTALRISFGAALIVSIAVVYSAIFFLSTSSSSDDRRDDRRGGGGMGFGGGFGGGIYWGPSPFDVFYYRPYYSYGRSYESPQEMGFLEAVYSYVFGDGDPNVDLDDRSIKAAATVIREAGGAVTAEQLAPYLAPSDSAVSFDTSVVDESFVLPVVTRLNGVPEVTDEGDIVYVFDELQVSAAMADLEEGQDEEARMRARMEEGLQEAYLEEREVEFSAADDGKLFFAGALGVVNFLGAAYLGIQLTSVPSGAVLPGFLGIVQAIYPLLLLYAISFNAAPAWRNFSMKAENEKIAERNTARRQAAFALQAGLSGGLGSGEGNKKLKGKIRAAKALGSGEVKRIRSDDVAYSTSDQFAEEAKTKMVESDLDDFDKRLNG